ncbi:MAG: 50S ribosomal protein L23 [Bacteroidota bacterium]
MSIIKKPVLTEKYTAMNAAGKYTFIVDPKANKIEIAKEVKKMYGVEVKSVNTLKQIGKKRSRSTKTKVTSGLTQTTKRAVVTVAKGEIIDFYQGL